MDYGSGSEGYQPLPEAFRLEHQTNLRPARLPQPVFFWQIRKDTFGYDSHAVPCQSITLEQ